MPQASEVLRLEWNGPSDRDAVAYLRGRGYVLQRDWFWRVPPNTVPTDKDIRAVRFLFDEWDYGGLAE
jgi:hypothetical protein